ncbi:MAG: CerR family C-terminal domain-containing protein [Gallionella sp.]|nr:CerR family C-terminal domain-containing protein [Gallionella sp.]
MTGAQAPQLNSASEQTRARLVDAARELFSAHGFQGATVREICRLADANVAAVNYHFGSKDGLLAEAFNFSALKALQKKNATVDACPEIRLHLFVRDFMLMLLDEKNASRQCRMMARELADPTPALDKIFVEAIAPLLDFLSRLVREIVGDRADEAALRRCVYSLLGQCVFYRNSHPVLQRLYPDLHYDVAEIEATARHIARFSIAGMMQAARGELDSRLFETGSGYTREL